jgi:hypothetical protein
VKCRGFYWNPNEVSRTSDNFWAYMHYILATVEGLHLTCDFVVYSAALYGCPPNYSPTPVGLHETYGQPHEILGSVPFEDYPHFALISSMDDQTLQALVGVPNRRMKDSTCVGFEIDVSMLDSRTNSSLLHELINRGERILDVIRLFLFKPGEDKSIGRVGAIGDGVSGVWLGDNAGHLQFIARKTSNYQLAQDPLEVSLADVRRIYNDPVFKELCSAASLNHEYDSLLHRIFQSLRTFRESRDIQSLEARFRHLAAIAEDLAKRDRGEWLRGKKLREHIAQIAENAWRANLDDVRTVTTDLWDNARNPLTHSVETFASIGRNPDLDISNMERTVVNMIEAVVIAWRNEQFGIAAYDSLLSRC